MTLEDLTKPNLVLLLGLGALSVAVPKMLPEMRPTVKSAIKFGLALFSESEGEAEADLIQSLVAATLAQIQKELSGPGSEPERRARVRRNIARFKDKARKRADRWASDEPGRRRSYRRHVAGLESALAARKQHADPDTQDIIEDAFVALAEGY